jgi:hypothetical protein
MEDTMKETKPKVEIGLNESVQLTLLKDKALVGENSYGPYFMYSVRDQEEEKVLFATSDVHKQILEGGLKSGDSFELKRVAMQNGRKLTSSFAFSILEKKNGNRQENHLTEGDRFRELMERSLEDAISATKAVNSVQWDVDSIRSIALSLFIQRVRAS